MAKYGRKDIDDYVRRCETGEPTARVYDDWANSYDEMFDSYAENNEPLFTTIKKLYGNDKSCRILDVGAGTGYAGERLRSLGFINIDGVEPSEKMLNVAISKKIYNVTYLQYVGSQALPVEDETYDCVLSARCIVTNHFPASAIKEFYRIVRTGGHIIIMGNLTTWSNLPEFHIDMKAEIDKLVVKKRLEEVEWTEFNNYALGDDVTHRGLLFAYKKM